MKWWGAESWLCSEIVRSHRIPSQIRNKSWYHSTGSVRVCGQVYLLCKSSNNVVNRSWSLVVQTEVGWENRRILISLLISDRPFGPIVVIHTFAHFYRLLFGYSTKMCLWTLTLGKRWVLTVQLLNSLQARNCWKKIYQMIQKCLVTILQLKTRVSCDAIRDGTYLNFLPQQQNNRGGQY